MERWLLEGKGHQGGSILFVLFLKRQELLQLLHMLMGMIPIEREIMIQKGR